MSTPVFCFETPSLGWANVYFTGLINGLQRVECRLTSQGWQISVDGWTSKPCSTDLPYAWLQAMIDLQYAVAGVRTI